MEGNTAPALKEKRNGRKKHTWKWIVEESAIIEKKQSPTSSYGRLSYNRSITTLNKLQRCDLKKKKHLFEDFGNSQRSQTSPVRSSESRESH